MTKSVGGSRGVGEGQGNISHVAIGFLRNSGSYPLEKQLDPMGPILFRGRFERPPVKYM